MVKKQQYEIVWTKRSQQHIRALYKHISKNSLQNAAMVIEDIVAAVEKAIPNPEFYAPDKYKTDNDNSYRAFEKHHYRVAFRFTKNIIRVLRVRHTKMEPKQY
jgi:plasmid stabilization system protein ParE